jgi:predicted enzyme related to lactoylglutathione lyase
MPPRDGFTVTHFITVADIDRSADFYEKVLAAAFRAEATARVRLGTFRSRMRG